MSALDPHRVGARMHIPLPEPEHLPTTLDPACWRTPHLVPALFSEMRAVDNLWRFVLRYRGATKSKALSHWSHS